MADDIVTRLRAQDICHDCLGTELCWEAADEIQRLREQVQGAEDVITMLLEEVRRG